MAHGSDAAAGEFGVWNTPEASAGLLNQKVDPEYPKSVTRGSDRVSPRTASHTNQKDDRRGQIGGIIGSRAEQPVCCRKSTRDNRNRTNCYSGPE